MVDRIKIGSFLRELRNEKGLTQEELAEKFDVSSRSVSRWENGNTMPELGILAWLVWMMKTIPLVRISDQDMHVESVYRFETEEGYRYFVLYDMPNYDCPTQIEYKVEDGNTLDMIPKKSLLGRKITTESPWKNILIYSCGYESGDNGKRIFDDFDVVKFAGEMVWNKEDNLDDQVPEYVGVYDQFESSSQKIASWTIEEDYMQAEYYDGRIERWDYSGNRIY